MILFFRIGSSFDRGSNMDHVPKDVDVKITLEPGAVMPTYATEGSAGLDLCAFESVTLQPMQRSLIRTGVRMEIPPGFEGQVRPRSGLAMRHGISLVNSPGTIDSDYRGEIGILAINLGSEIVQLNQGERIAQIVLCPVVRAQLQIETELSDSNRGAAGFGSTGR